MIPIFLSYPRPFNKKQKDFIEEIEKYLNGRGIEPRTLGVSDYNLKEPLTAIRRIILESNGLLTIAFRRAKIAKGVSKPNSDIGEKEYSIDDTWLTSPYCQIEPAMAFQVGLPVLILRENGVIADGILEKGVIGTYMPEFDLDNNMMDYLKSPEWIQIIAEWEGYVRNVVQTKGQPPKLY
ncbi:MAG: hypothetical protein Q8861_03240 [Bacteroidota bacterium]|nr:hypothetical protein [Bacteroidota bacterium]